jgi:hypothetical protein
MFEVSLRNPSRRGDRGQCRLGVDLDTRMSSEDPSDQADGGRQFTDPIHAGSAMSWNARETSR